MGDLRPVYGRNFVGYGRLRHRKRPYAVVYDRRNDRPGRVTGQFVAGQLVAMI